MAASPAWRDSPSFRRLSDAFDEDAARDPLIATDRAVELLGDATYVATLLDPLVAALAADPLYQPPLASSSKPGRAVVMLYDTPAVRVSATLMSIRGGAIPPASVILGSLTVARFVRAGDARIRRWRADPLTADFDAISATPASEIAALSPRDGDVIVQNATEGQVIEAAGDVVRIGASIRHGAAPLTREYAIADGSFLRAASNDEQSSRAGMLLTMLRLQRRTDAAPVFDAATRDPAFHVRWSSMREWLALDAVAALPRLREMAAGDPNREVRAAAGVTLTKLLARLEQRACPA